MTVFNKTTMVLATILLSGSLFAAPLDTFLQGYRDQGAGTFNAERGQTLWKKTFTGKQPHRQRSCQSCHGKNLKQSGEHVKSGKTIKAMAPSVQADRYTDLKKIEKWFKRNCKWTFGRVCTAQEKGDFLSFLKSY